MTVNCKHYPFQLLMSSVMLQCTQRNVQIPYSSTDGKWTVLALDLAALLAPVTTAAFEETKTIQFCANMVVRGAFTADNSYTRQVRSFSFCVQNAPGIFLTNKQLPAAVLSPVICNIVCCQWLDWQHTYLPGMDVHALSNSADCCSSQTCKVWLTTLCNIADFAQGIGAISCIGTCRPELGVDASGACWTACTPQVHDHKCSPPAFDGLALSYDSHPSACRWLSLKQQIWLTLCMLSCCCG